MILCFFLKLLTHCSLYFLLANGFMSVAYTGISSLLPAIICSLIGTAAFWLDMHDKNNIRYMLYPLLLTVFFFVEGIGPTIALIPVVFYIFMIIKEKLFSVDLESQRNWFRWGLVVCFIFCFTLGLYIRLRWVVPFVVIFLLGNMLFMHLFRQSRNKLHNRKYLLHTTLQLVMALIGAVIVSSSFVIRLIGMVWDKIFDIFLEPIVKVLATILMWGGTVINNIIQFIFSHLHKLEQHNRFNPGEWHDEGFYAQIEETMAQDSPAVVLLLICTLLISFYFICKLMKHRGNRHKVSIQANVKVTRQTIIEGKKEKARLVQTDLLPPVDSRLAVRYYYRKFLNLCDRLDYHFKDSFTSEKIAYIVSKKMDKNMVCSIRNQYIIARYSFKEVTLQDILTIKRCVDYLKKVYEIK